MCGICGAIGIESRDEGAAVLSRMLRSIYHRGPDEEGTLVEPRYAAGTRRLSIIDLAGGSQPIWNETRTLAVNFNGEIYNYRELRAELLAAGHKFRTQSDTEVIVHAYEEWGTEGFARLHGMFAFVLAEMPEGTDGPVTRAIIARDRFGIKPLYYAGVEGNLYFASEVRALIASGRVRPKISAQAVSSYLLFGSVGEPVTLLDGVCSLPPAHFLKVSMDFSASYLRPKPYWSVTEASISKGSPRASETQPAAEVRSRLENSVRSHLIADVPVGVFLSSGLDSTAIAALAARVHPGIHTFTVAFPDLEFSEAGEARRIAGKLGTTHSELELSGEEMLARLDEAIAGFDQPSMDGVNTYFVSWAARQSGLKVALSGLGSDEIFGGYPTFRSTRSLAKLATIANAVPSSIRRAVASTAKGVKSGPAFEKASAAWVTPDSLPHPYFFTRALFTPEQISKFSPISAKAGRGSQNWSEWLTASVRETDHMDPFTAVSWLELRSYMLNTLLRDTDSMSMAHSLEVRVPFLAPDLVEYVLALPESDKRDPQRPKSLLIDALADLWPEGIVGQRKRTFTFPWENWLRGPLSQRITTGLADWSIALTPVLNCEFARKVWQDFQQGRTTWSRVWSLYVLNEWAKRHLDAADPEPNRASAVTTTA